ncbi:VOC family protein [Altererythrobacter sp. B11]|uniref:VOC family protein n=1 Tax=Altererythrobacter sp. B11 TaxID=2060312 RepID=UPI000E5BADD2|nr:VOC family protein [Altererythrobacter sp. B11]
MERAIFVNLPVTDLPRSVKFYEALGFTNDPRFTNDQAAAMEWSGTIKVMLLTHDFWRTFTSKAIVDAHAAAQVALCVSRASRDEVDAMVSTAAQAGGKADPSPAQDMELMYCRSLEDPDGHVWEPMWMDPAFADAAPADHQPA